MFATGDGPVRPRWRLATREPVSWRLSGRASLLVCRLSRSRCRGWCRAGTCRACRAGRPWASVDPPVPLRHRLLDGETALHRPRGAGTAGAGPAGEAVLSYCGIATMSEATVVPEAAAIPIPDGRSFGRRADRVLRLDRGGAPRSRRPRSRPARRSRSSVSAGWGCRASWVPRSRARHGSWRSTGSPRSLRPRSRWAPRTACWTGSDDVETLTALRDLTDGGPDYAFEAIGLPFDGRARHFVASTKPGRPFWWG